MSKILLKIKIEGYNVKGRYREAYPTAIEEVNIVVDGKHCNKVVEDTMSNIYERITNGTAKRTFECSLEDDTEMVEDENLFLGVEEE